MGKGGELWDDSALVDAFDHAVATYKSMHGKNRSQKSEDVAAAPREEQESEDVAAAAAAAGEEPVSAAASDEHIDKDDSCTNVSNPMEAPQQPCEASKATEQSALQEPDLNKETRPSDITDTKRNDSSNQQAWDYNELLRKYYELEVESQKVLEQLHQTNYWSYQTPEQSSAYKQQQVPAYSATAPDPHSSTTQPSCCSLNIPMVSVSCCSAGHETSYSTTMPPNGSCRISLTCDQCPGASTTYPTGATMQLPTEMSANNDPVAKAAMLTAEGVMNFMKSTIPGDQGSFPRKEGEAGKEKRAAVGMNLNLDTTGADNDLAVVLNAWYAAGFYTGRYLMQQSTKNSQQN